MANGFRFGRHSLVAVLAATMALRAVSAAELEVLTQDDNSTIDETTLVVRVVGPLDNNTARDLATAWSDRPGAINRLLIDLDSPGGSLAATEAIIERIAAIRSEARIDTLVRHGALCASACVAVFMQGEDRAAGGASVWLFHGVCTADSNTPMLGQTIRFLDMLREGGASEEFLCRLIDEGVMTTAGKLWLSGYELHHVYEANVITRLLEPWRPEVPVLPSRPVIEPR